MLTENPSVFKHWETPLEIIEYVDCEASPITHLSPLLTFSGRDNVGDSACFLKCAQLENASGTFNGYVYFTHSNIRKLKTRRQFPRMQNPRKHNRHISRLCQPCRYKNTKHLRPPHSSPIVYRRIRQFEKLPQLRESRRMGSL